MQVQSDVCEVRSDVHEVRSDVREVRVLVQSLQCYAGRSGTQLLKTIVAGCVTLVDATGHQHRLLVEQCNTFQVRLARVNLWLKEAY
jgi:hypothetical protein